MHTYKKYKYYRQDKTQHNTMNMTSSAALIYVMSNFNLIEQKHLWPVQEQHELICLELLDLKTYSTYEHGITLSVYQVSNACTG